MHVIDLIDAHIKALTYLRNKGESNVFNLGSGEGFSVKEIIEVARKVTGHPIPEKVDARRAGDPSTLIASSEKARSVLKWDPQYTKVETIISDAWRFHLSHPNGYKA